MKGKFSIFALSALMLASCSTSELTDENLGNGIAFTASVGKQSRTTSDDLNKNGGSFHMWAFSDGKDFFAAGGQELSYTDGTWNYGGTKYWPQTEVQFYSIYPASAKDNATVNATNQTLAYTVAPTAAEDLLYATNKESKPASSTSKVKVNFRHALAAVSFAAQNTNSNISVQIQGIKIDNLKNAGTFSWATATTATDNTNKGSWSAAAGAETYDFGTASYSVTSTVAPVAGTKELYLLPQDLTAWKTAEGWNDNGNRILVNCVIKQGEQLLWNGPVALSLAGKWEMGKKYVYTLKFGEGAGYDPESKNPVLVPVAFEVSVDNFSEIIKNDING